MAFERIAIAVAKVKAPAGVTITHLGKAVVALRKDIVAASGFKADQKFAVLIGTDTDSGKLRLVRDKDGVACARELVKTGAFFFNLGVVPALGTSPHKQRPALARVIDDGVEIDIPPALEGDDEEDEEDEDADEQDDGDEAEEAAPPPPAPARRKTGAVPATLINGIEIDLTVDEESVFFAGKSTEVTSRQAKLVSLLARPRPSPVAESFLVGALWDGRPPKDAKEQLRQIAADLKIGLATIGLDLREVKGVGYQLRDL